MKFFTFKHLITYVIVLIFNLKVDAQERQFVDADPSTPIYQFLPHKFLLYDPTSVITNILLGSSVEGGVAKSVSGRNKNTEIPTLDLGYLQSVPRNIYVGEITPFSILCPQNANYINCVNNTPVNFILLELVWNEVGQKSFTINFGKGGTSDNNNSTFSYSSGLTVNVLPCRKDFKGRCIDQILPIQTSPPLPGSIFPIFQLASVSNTPKTINLVYPSISSDVIQVAEFSDIKSIRVIDLLGNVKKQIESPENSSSLKINVSNYINGMYLVQFLSNDGEITTQKFQVVHE